MDPLILPRLQFAPTISRHIRRPAFAIAAMKDHDTRNLKTGCEVGNAGVVAHQQPALTQQGRQSAEAGAAERAREVGREIKHEAEHATQEIKHGVEELDPDRDVRA